MRKIHDWFIDKILSNWFLVSRRNAPYKIKLAIVKHNGRWLRK